MYSLRWIEYRLKDYFFRWVDFHEIPHELVNPLAAFGKDDFQVRMHWRDWKKFEEHF
jgi:hypothetical protein